MSTVLLQEGQKEMQTAFSTNELATGIRYGDVYISPSHIKFNEAFEGVTHRQRIIIKNVGYKPAFIRICQLNSIAFQVKTLKSGIRVSPGLSITTYVTYTFKRTSISHAIIPIEINGKIFDYRVISTLATEHISIEPKSIDFGIIDVGYLSGLKIITIRNEGDKSTRFSIDLGQNDLDLIIKPLRGRIKPQRQVKLQVELMGVNEGTFYSEFWIKSTPNICIPVKVHVIVPRLVIYHPNATGDFTLIDFPPTIENTCRYDTFVLRNLSSRVSSYIVLGEIGNEVKCIQNIDRKQYPTYGVFAIHPLEGRINPFQGIIFEVKFSPISALSQRRKEQERKEWRRCENKYSSQKNRDFMQFIRIIRIHCTESEDISQIELVEDTSMDKVLSQRIYIQEPMMETSSVLMSRASSTDSGICEVIKLCLYGEVEVIQLHIEPDILYFGDLIVGQISQRVLRLTNPSAVAPIYLECAPNAVARCCPSWMKLKPKTSIEVLVKVCGKESIEPSFKLFFNVAADSYDSTVSRRCFGRIKVGSYFVECTVNIVFKSKKDLLSKRSLSTKIVDDDEEIIKRLLRPPKWKLLCKDYSEIINKCVGNVSSPLKESSFVTKAAVSLPLSPLQIYKIQVSPTTFAFGMVAPNSFNYRRLIVKNTNDIPVMIRLISLPTKCIRFPEGDLMILQPDSTMTRLVEYFADRVNGNFNGYINYVINENQSFGLSITACIVHKQLYVDTKEIEFKEWRGEVYQPRASVVRITNKLGLKIRFRWEVPVTSGFHIEPEWGSVRGNSTLHVYVHYEPDNVRNNYVQAMMTCEGGSRVPLQLEVPRFVPRVEFLNDNANLGEIPLNLPTKVIAVLQNHDLNEVTYEIDSASLVRGCNVNPLRGEISPRGIAILEVHLTFDICCRFTTVIAVTIQKCLRLLYKINGSVSFPKLKLSPQRIDIKRFNIDAFQTHLITATNVGTTLLKLQILLEEYPEFRVSLMTNGKSSEIDTEGITIVPGASQNLYLHFQPVDLASYAFYLPIVINQLLGPVSMLNPKSIRPAEFLKLHEAHYVHLSGFAMTPLPDKLPTVSIDYTVAGRVVFFSKLLFRFNVATNELSEELFIENRATPWPREIVMSINIEEFNKADCPFAIEWSHGAEIGRTRDSIECTLRPGGSVSFVLEFRPSKCGSFSAEAPIYVCGELDNGIFNKLHLDGEFPASSIDVEPTEIFLTPVPLGTVIEEKFRIRARHFDSTAFIRPNFLTTPRYSGDYKDELLRVDFPNGNAVAPHSYVELEAKITFKSDQPVSFCLIVEFSDDHRLAACFLTVYATADNNLLTTYMYLMKSSFDKTQLEKHVPCPSDSPADEDNYDNEEIPHARRHSKLLESGLITSRFDDRSISFVDKTTNSKLNWNKEINHNEIDSKIMHVNGKRTLDNNSKRLSMHNTSSVFFIPLGEKDSRYSERLLHPNYPANDRNDDYEKHVQRIITIMEEWMYSDPLKFRFYPNIPYGITSAFSYNFRMKNKSYVKNSKEESNVTMLSFINVLESLIGPDIRTYLGKLLKQLLPENDIERIDYVLQLYNKTLDFLVSQGAYLIHVSPQYLLNYDDYLVSIDIVQNNARRKESFNTSCERLSRQLFESRNKQCWLDVILQTYKCLVLRGIHEQKFWTSSRFPRKSAVHCKLMVSSTSSLSKQNELHEEVIQSIANSPDCELASDDRCPEEKFLLAWLRYHYDEQRVRDWMTDRRVILNPREKQDVAEHRAIGDFHRDFSDSLVLIAVTAAYCPFLIDECFTNLYICPRNKQEMLHNAICLVTAWRKIRLGFMITPMQLVNPNQMQILMLTVHLFQALPTYIPCAKMRFNCPLSQTVTKQIRVSNPTNNIVHYLLLLVNDVNHLFTILKPVSILCLNAHDSGQIQIQFHAKKIWKNRAYLVLCGRTTEHFGRNQTIVLEGHIDNLGITNKYTIRSKLYQIVETNLKINVPYQNAAEYDIWMTDERPSHPSTLKMTRWRELRTRKILRRLFLNQESIVVSEGASKANLSITVACITPKQQTFWLIFQSKTNDFIIQIKSIWQMSVNDHLVVEWTAQDKCVCSNLQNGVRDICPFNVSLPIPSCNVQLRKCVAEMFQKTLDSQERLFWSKYLNTYSLRLIKWLMESDDSATLEFVHVFNTAVTYKVTTSDKSSPLVLPERFTIQDVRPFNQEVPMMIHISPTTPPLYEVTITLTSLDNKELRVYTISCLRS